MMRPTTAPLAFKVEWVRPANQEDTKMRYMPVQQNIADPNVIMTFYGKAAKQILTTGTPGSKETPYGVWTGTAEGPFAVTFKLKDSFVDMTGLGNIRWFAKTSGFHAIRPVIKLANGNLQPAAGAPLPGPPSTKIGLLISSVIRTLSLPSPVRI